MEGYDDMQLLFDGMAKIDVTTRLMMNIKANFEESFQQFTRSENSISAFFKPER